MAILKMKKLRICGVSEEQTQLIRQLQLLGGRAEPDIRRTRLRAGNTQAV